MTKIITCVVCGSLLKGKATRFCSRKCQAQESNNKHQNYQAQQSRGRERKIFLVQSKGGKCELCGYSRNLSALCFHHKSTSTKRFELDLRNLSNRAWREITKEAEGCALLCHNCHTEVHHPVTEFTPSAYHGTARPPRDLYAPASPCDPPDRGT